MRYLPTWTLWDLSFPAVVAADVVQKVLLRLSTFTMFRVVCCRRPGVRVLSHSPNGSQTLRTLNSVNAKPFNVGPYQISSASPRSPSIEAVYYLSPGEFPYRYFGPKLASVQVLGPEGR